MTTTKSEQRLEPFVHYLSCGVDAGNISVINAESVMHPHNPFTTHIAMPQGEGDYRVTLTIPSTWNGPITKSAILTSPSGEFVVGDACYSFMDVDNTPWENFLRNTGFLGTELEEANITPPTYAMFVDTGGDGLFDIMLTLEFMG